MTLIKTALLISFFSAVVFSQDNSIKLHSNNAISLYGGIFATASYAALMATTIHGLSINPDTNAKRHWTRRHTRQIIRNLYCMSLGISLNISFRKRLEKD
jgi:hypothetical protein